MLPALGRGTTLAYDERIPGVSHLSQVRSFGSHRDRVTGIDYVFAGHDPRGIFSGVYDPAVPGRIRWSETAEFDISTISVADFPGMEGRLRVTSFAECNDRLYATVGQQIYERTDGQRRNGASSTPIASPAVPRAGCAA